MTPVGTIRGYSHVADVMGMAVSIDVRDPVAGQPGLAEVLDWFDHVDATFSTYRPDSPITRIGRGELAVADAGPEVAEVLLACEDLRQRTGGIFDAFDVPAPNGSSLDPSGYVKGWSVDVAARILVEAGLADFCINAGGDVVVHGQAAPGVPWTVGIRHPDDPLALAAVLRASGTVAIATSATYQRGAHIVDPRTGRATTALASATVLGPDLATTDALATVAFVLGPEAVEWIAACPDHDAILLTHDGRLLASAGQRRLPSGAWLRVADFEQLAGHLSPEVTRRVAYRGESSSAGLEIGHRPR